MRVETADGGPGRRVLTGMIMDPGVLSQLAPDWPEHGRFASPWENTVAGWCRSYYDTYGKAPGKAVEGLFETWSEDTPDKDGVKLVEAFLSGLSGEYAALKKDVNTQYTLDLAKRHFNKVALGKLAERLQGDVDSGDLDKALKRVSTFGAVQVGGGGMLNFMDSGTAMKAAFRAKKAPLIVYPDALGVFFGDALERDGFISLLAPEKRGKTFLLMDMAWQAMCQGRRVAFFQVGDLSEAQILRRFAVRAARRPLTPGILRVPIKIESPTGGNGSMAEVTFRDEGFPKPLTYKRALREIDKLSRTTAGGDKSLLKIGTWPAQTLTAKGVVAKVQELDRKGWTPDVVIVDYADILANPPGEMGRDAINSNWMTLRALSQMFHCLVITATQSSAASYKADTIDRTMFSEDKRKFAHVTGMLAVNQTADEKLSQLYRFSWAALREAEYHEGKSVHAAGCLGLAAPLMLSTF